MATSEVAAAERCVKPHRTRIGTMIVPPPMPKNPDRTPASRPAAQKAATLRGVKW
jgi:hypothetical protein